MGRDDAAGVSIITTQDKALVQLPANNSALLAREAETRNPQGLDGRQESFLNVDDANVLLETWKPAEDGNGTILRFADFGGTERTVMVKTPLLHVGQVSQTDAVERGQAEVAVDGSSGFHFTMHPHEIVTLRMVGSK